MYQVNAPRVIHETLDGETIVIDTQAGFYYTAAGHASVIWLALVAGQAPQKIVDAYTAAGLIAQSEIHKFIKDLLDAELIVVAAGDHVISSVFSIPAIAGMDAPDLQFKCHSDLHELIEMDPIHEVDMSRGWPVQNKAEA